jgi:hypothetical protein
MKMCARLKKHLEEEIITQSYKEEDDDEDQASDYHRVHGQA